MVVVLQLVSLLSKYFNMVQLSYIALTFLLATSTLAAPTKRKNNQRQASRPSPQQAAPQQAPRPPPQQAAQRQAQPPPQHPVAPPAAAAASPEQESPAISKLENIATIAGHGATIAGAFQAAAPAPVAARDYNEVVLKRRQPMPDFDAEDELYVFPHLFFVNVYLFVFGLCRNLLSARELDELYLD